MQDYYTILGLDATASAQSIKIAYRRLARENHPDHKGAMTDAEKNSSAMVMSELNEAYAVLSHPSQRRAYDEKLRLMGLLSTGNTAGSATATKSASTPVPAAPSPARTSDTARVRPRHQTDSNVLDELSHYLWEKLVTKNPTFPWKQVPFEGFDNGAEAVSWSSCYCIALRGFSLLDGPTAKKFLNYSDFAVAGHKRQLRKTYFLFLMPFQRVNDWESIANRCQAFVADKNRSAQSAVVLLDMRHGQIRRFGTPFHDKKLEQFVQSIRTSA